MLLIVSKLSLVYLQDLTPFAGLALQNPLVRVYCFGSVEGA